MTNSKFLPFEELPQSEKFHAPLQQGDAPEKTIGCRHTSPNICKKNMMASVCAFARKDRVCLAPPVSWAKQFTVLAKSGEKDELG